MGKLQPNFSWQAYEKNHDKTGQKQQTNPRDEKDETTQYQFQMQQEHILVANTCNGTIDDLSYFATERATAWAWIDDSQIYKESYPVVWNAGGTQSVIYMDITNPDGTDADITLIYMQCCISNGALSTSDTINLPHIDPSNSANEISIVRNGVNIVINTGGTNYSAFSGYVTIYFIYTDS